MNLTGMLRVPGGFSRPQESGNKWTINVVRYVFAAAVVALTAGLRWWLVRTFGPMPTYLTFYPGVLLVAILAGGGPGIAAAILSALAADYLFIGPFGHFGGFAPNEAIAIGIFIGTGIFLSVLAERLRRAR